MTTITQNYTDDVSHLDKIKGSMTGETPTGKNLLPPESIELRETHNHVFDLSIEEKTARVSQGLNERLARLGRRVEVEIDAETGKIVLTVYDMHHDAVVMQLPPESFLKLSENMNKLAGVIIEKIG